ncbi:hypothetical protein TNCV_3829751 [Trichonephila clavipes]|nr:hypothetical protein TNCV_3829751 [Trichonephila clavipes]
MGGCLRRKMSDILGIQRGEIVGVWLAGESVTQATLTFMRVYRRQLHKQSVYGRAAMSKPLVTDIDAKCRLQWCPTHKSWSIDKWKRLFDESSFTFSYNMTSTRLEVTCTSV